MKLAALKEQTQRIWLLWQKCAEVVVQPQNYKADVRAFGDLRRKDTWKRALGTFFALSIARTSIDAVEIVSFYLNPAPGTWEWEVRHETFEAFINIPGGLEAVQRGLNELSISPDRNHGDNL
ncbi:MAG: hypothetical protein SWY16_27095, partial [Cyanobacteriota bacterium]|nr:hypothetical protein [Cyanobacteriota bacterium]